MFTLEFEVEDNAVSVRNSKGARVTVLEGVSDGDMRKLNGWWHNRTSYRRTIKCQNGELQINHESFTVVRGRKVYSGRRPSRKVGDAEKLLRPARTKAPAREGYRWEFAGETPPETPKPRHRFDKRKGRRSGKRAHIAHQLEVLGVWDD